MLITQPLSPHFVHPSLPQRLSSAPDAQLSSRRPAAEQLSLGNDSDRMNIIPALPRLSASDSDSSSHIASASPQASDSGSLPPSSDSSTTISLIHQSSGDIKSFASYEALLAHLERKRIELNDSSYSVVTSLSSHQIFPLRTFHLVYYRFINGMDKATGLSAQCLQLSQLNGFRHHRIVGDGNCLFRSISYWLFGSESSHPRVRHEIVAAMKSMQYFEEKYENQCREAYKKHSDDTKDYNGYLSRMKKNTVYGTFLELEAVAIIYQFNAHVVIDGGDRTEWAFMNLPSAEWAFRNRPSEADLSLPHYYFAFRNMNHYDVMLKIGEQNLVTVPKNLESQTLRMKETLRPAMPSELQADSNSEDEDVDDEDDDDDGDKCQSAQEYVEEDDGLSDADEADAEALSPALYFIFIFRFNSTHFRQSLNTLEQLRAQCEKLGETATKGFVRFVAHLPQRSFADAASIQQLQSAAGGPGKIKFFVYKDELSDYLPLLQLSSLWIGSDELLTTFGINVENAADSTVYLTTIDSSSDPLSLYFNLVDSITQLTSMQKQILLPLWLAESENGKCKSSLRRLPISPPSNPHASHWHPCLEGIVWKHGSASNLFMERNKKTDRLKKILVPDGREISYCVPRR